MKECKCLTVKLYDDDGWRCMECYKQFEPADKLKAVDDAVPWEWKEMANLKYGSMIFESPYEEPKGHGTG